MDKIQLLQKAIKQYGINPTSLMIENELQPNSWHGDLHFKIHVDKKSYSARFIGNNRYETDVFIKLSDEVLTEQMKFCKYLRNSGIPFMEHVSTSKGEPFTSVKDVDKEWKFVLFEWIQGEHLTHCTEFIECTILMVCKGIDEMRQVVFFSQN